MTGWRDVCVTHHYAVLLFYRLGLSRIAVSLPWLFAIGLTLSTSGFILLGVWVNAMQQLPSVRY